MELTIRVTSKDRNGVEVTSGDMVEFVDDCNNKNVVTMVESLDLGRVEFDPAKGLHIEQGVEYFNLTNGDFAHPHLCTKVEQTVEERIAAVMEDTSLTLGERVGRVIAISKEA